MSTNPSRVHEAPIVDSNPNSPISQVATKAKETELQLAADTKQDAPEPKREEFEDMARSSLSLVTVATLFGLAFIVVFRNRYS